MLPLIKRLLLKALFLLVVSIQVTHSQKSHYNLRYDSLANSLDKQTTDEGRIKLLMLLVDLAPPPAAEPAERTIGYLVRLIQYDKKVKLFDITPYKILLEGYYLWRKKEYQNALTELKKAVDLFDSEKKIIVNLLTEIRLLFNRLDQQEERFKFYKEKLAYYLITGPVENTASCYHGIAFYYFIKGNHNLSISNYLRAASVFKNFYLFYYYHEIGVVGVNYNAWGNDERATYYLKMAIPMFRALPDSSMLAYCLNDFSKLATKNQKFDEALQYADESINVCSKEIIDPAYAIAILQKGFVYLEKKQPELAYSYLTKAKVLSDSLYTQIQSSQGTLEIDFAFYRYHFLMKNSILAEKSLLKAYEKATNEKSDLFQLKYLKELSVFYESRKNSALALQYIRQYFALNNKIEKKQNTFKVAQFENEQKELQQIQNIAALKQERAIQEATLNQRNIILWISLCALILVCTLLIFLYRQFHLNKKTLLSLRKTQRQLIMSEKMASLGELTAGIAHEIQNPLNFVNNFSEVNKELLLEMNDEIDKGNLDEVKVIANNLVENEGKINHHGKRADAIVKGMLQHSRVGAGQKEAADINALADEYLRLAYHGLRAKDKSFNADFKTDLDESIGKINIVPQDIGRVLLNLFNNAFYAVNEKKKLMANSYQPIAKVTTRKLNDKIEIRVADNGNGIPQKIVDKIFQPFFTTKPTGQGTGLGLSLSYDIIKAHGGEIKVETKEGEGSMFIIQLSL